MVETHICPNCNGVYRSISTVERHKAVGCPKQKTPQLKAKKIIPSAENNETVFEIPDFDTMLNSENIDSPSDSNIKDFINSLEVEGEEGEEKINVSSMLADSEMLDGIFIKLDDVMYENYYDKTGEELWNPVRRDMERNILLFIIKINVKNTLIRISPLAALAGFSVYFYGIPVVKILKLRGEIDEREENRERENNE